MRVLLVEDDYAVSQSIETMLKKEGMIIDTTDLGEDGLEIGKLYDYDIIILDLMLPSNTVMVFRSSFVPVFAFAWAMPLRISLRIFNTVSTAVSVLETSL